MGLVANESEAVPALKRAIQLDPSRADVRIWLATRLTQALRYDEALPFSRDAAAIEPLWPMPIYDLVVRLAVNGQVAEARQAAAQYRSRSGNDAQYLRLLFAIESRGPDISSAVGIGEKALALDSTLPNIRAELMQLYNLVGLKERAPSGAPQVGLAALLYRGETSALQSRIRSSNARLWDLPDSSIGFFHLAAIHDWKTLNRLYEQRPTPPGKLCIHSLEAAQAIVPSLRAAGRRGDADTLLSCLRNRLGLERRQKARSWYAYDGDLEYDQATLATLANDRASTLRFLKQAIARGWLGRPYSSNLSDRPQFDSLREDPVYAELQNRIDTTLERERAEIESGR
jgi:hypothetical protein